MFDGHNGVLAAQYISDTLLMRLVQKLPPGRPPAERSPKFKAWREGICRALAEVLSEIHLSFAKLGQLAGCTVTIVLQVRMTGRPTSSTRLSFLFTASSLAACDISHPQTHIAPCRFPFRRRPGGW